MPENLKDQIIIEKLPRHIAVIMDGNGRWAKKNNKNRIFGHQNGVKAVREVTEGCAELGVKYLTLYAFSTENWSRPRLEINALMELLVKTLRKELKTLQENKIKLKAVGNLESLPKKCYKELRETMEETADNDGMTLILALSYSSKWEIANAVRQIAKKAIAGEIAPEEISEKTVEEHLCTQNIPDPELLIRTSGEYRISNFLLWQIAYTELYFTNVLWPDFSRNNLYEAIIDYQPRERRFGKISEQVRGITN